MVHFTLRVREFQHIDSLEVAACTVTRQYQIMHIIGKLFKGHHNSIMTLQYMSDPSFPYSCT